jgi:hypothetical protein
MHTFEVGQILKTRSICNYDCVYTAEVMKRTAKTITIKEGDEIKTRRIFIYDDVECIKPHGNYSMSATFRADGAE